jgi:hypothetical protein
MDLREVGWDVCMYKGWAGIPALSPRPSMIYCALGWDDMDWIYLAQDRDRWGALVNTEMNLRVP